MRVSSEKRVVVHRVAPVGKASYLEVRNELHALLRGLEFTSDLVRPGDHVVIKPNWVRQADERDLTDQRWEHVVTHPSVIDAVVQWVAEQLKGTGRIAICDAPQTDSSFQKLAANCGFDSLQERWRESFPGCSINILDLRPEEWESKHGVVIDKQTLPGDPIGSTRVCLNESSEFVGFHGLGKLYGASFDMDETNRRHQGTSHEYMLCRTPMDADVLINIPKLKTHKKVGLTCALKNLVGINANKNWLPHHTEGFPGNGGDQYPAATRAAGFEQAAMHRLKAILNGNHLLSKAFVPLKKLGMSMLGDNQATVRSGNWHGNDTCWRMVLDLNKCLFYFDGSGQRRKRPLRYLSVVDGVVAGEGNGPMAADPVAAGVLIVSTNPVATDAVCASLMGFDWKKIQMIKRAFEIDRLPLIECTPQDISVSSNVEEWSKPLLEFRRGDAFEFKPHFGWTGAIELEDSSECDIECALRSSIG